MTVSDPHGAQALQVKRQALLDAFPVLETLPEAHCPFCLGVEVLTLYGPDTFTVWQALAGFDNSAATASAEVELTGSKDQ